MEKKIFKKYMSSPIGGLELVCTEKGLSAIHFVSSQKKMKTNDQHSMLHLVEEQLLDYFNKKRKKFDVPLDLSGTEFQLKAWKALLKIPYGERRSYGEQAKVMGKTSHYSRAVGGANNKNPIPIIVPCHRVVGSNQELVGYAGGLKIKKFLLDLES